MEVRSFIYGKFAVVVSAKTAQGLIEIRNGLRWSGVRNEVISFQNGQIVVDFARRFVMEGPQATLQYWVLEGERTVFDVTGVGQERRRSAEMVPGSSGMYVF